MEFCSLPDELITNVFKYTKFGKIRKLRKMNQRIDQISRRRKISRIPLEYFEINESHILLRADKLLLDEDENGTEGFVTEILNVPDGAARLQLIENLLPNIKLNNRLTLKDLTFDDQLLQTIERSQPDIRYLSALELFNVTFTLSAERSLQFFKMCPNVNDIWFRGCDGEIDYIINEKTLGRRKWKSFWLYNQKTKPREIKFLQQVAAVSKSFSVDFCLFSISEAIYMFKKWSVDGICDRVIDLGNCLTPRLEAQQLVETIKQTLPDLRLLYKLDTRIRSDQLICGDWGTNFIKFRIVYPE